MKLFSSNTPRVLSVVQEIIWVIGLTAIATASAVVVVLVASGHLTL
jgi:hypothetical protein